MRISLTGEHMTEEEATVFHKYTTHEGNRPGLKVGVQGFRLAECDDAEHADWMRWMLAKALIRFKEAEEKT